MATPNGDAIHIEERDPGELLGIAGTRTVAEGVPAWNPVFDVTPASLIDAIVTEKGVIEQPDGARMRRPSAASSMRGAAWGAGERCAASYRCATRPMPHGGGRLRRLRSFRARVTPGWIASSGRI